MSAGAQIDGASDGRRAEMVGQRIIEPLLVSHERPCFLLIRGLSRTGLGTVEKAATPKYLNLRGQVTAKVRARARSFPVNELRARAYVCTCVEAARIVH